MGEARARGSVGEKARAVPTTARRSHVDPHFRTLRRRQPHANTLTMAKLALALMLAPVSTSHPCAARAARKTPQNSPPAGRGSSAFNEPRRPAQLGDAAPDPSLRPLPAAPEHRPFDLQPLPPLPPRDLILARARLQLARTRSLGRRRALHPQHPSPRRPLPAAPDHRPLPLQHPLQPRGVLRGRAPIGSDSPESVARRRRRTPPPATTRPRAPSRRPQTLRPPGARARKLTRCPT